MTEALLTRIAEALERLAPPPAASPDFTAPAFIWQSSPEALLPLHHIAAQPLDVLVGITRARDILLDNTRAFARGLPANNALLWGARGMGKSSLVKAVHGALRAEGFDLKIVELAREDLATIPRLLAHLRAAPYRFILYCDDLSFDIGDQHYKSLKAVLDGGLAGRPDNVVLYATSNRRHLMPRDMIENEAQAAIHATEAIEEKVSLSDRFGLWLGFHACDQDEYLAMIAGYLRSYGMDMPLADWRAEALEWQITRGSRSGRVAWQFFCALAAQHGRRL
ncbi:MAG: ATP-binding protein [Cypionkella sp.]|nr:ATP-binding protein [Cypionkella sp.]